MVNIKFANDFDKGKLQFEKMSKNKNGKGSTAKVDYADGNHFEGAPCRVSFPIKPGMDEVVVTDYMKMNLTMELNPDDEQQFYMKQKLEKLDEGILEFIFQNKSKILGDKAQFYDSPNSLRGMLSPIVKQGKTSEDGRTYKPSYSIKVVGLAKLIDHLECEEKVNKDGSKSQVVKSVVWKNDLDTARDKKKTGEILFWLCTGKEDEKDESGKLTGRSIDRVTQKVPLTTADDKPVLDAEGKPVKRWVGPQDIKPGCIVRPLFSIKKVWHVQTFGGHLELEGVRIYPPPPKPVVELEDAVEEDEDTLVTSEILKQIEKRADVGPPAAVEPPKDEEVAEGDSVAAPDVPAATSSSGRKRKADETAEASPVAPKTTKAKKGKAADETI